MNRRHVVSYSWSFPFPTARSYAQFFSSNHNMAYLEIQSFNDFSPFLSHSKVNVEVCCFQRHVVILSLFENSRQITMWISRYVVI